MTARARITAVTVPSLEPDRLEPFVGRERVERLERTAETVPFPVSTLRRSSVVGMHGIMPGMTGNLYLGTSGFA